jgi:hypothetical protein
VEMNDDIFGSIADEHYERALLLLYSIADQCWNSRVSTRLLVLAYKVMVAKLRNRRRYIFMQTTRQLRLTQLS